MKLPNKNKLPGLVVLLAVYVAGIILLVFTNPRSLPSVALILPFVVLFVAVYMTIVQLLRFVRSKSVQEGTRGLSTRPRLVAFLASGIPTLLLILGSIGQLGFIDISITISILVVGYFYISRSSTTG